MPTKEVMVPMGSSTGENNILDKRSHNKAKMAPPKRQQGKSFLCDGPVRSLMIWGVTSPTKPMGPDIDTQSPTRKEDDIITRSLTFFVFTPTDTAVSSPMENASSSLAR